MKRKKISIRNLVNVLCYDTMAEIIKAEYLYVKRSPTKEENIDTVTMLEGISLLEDSVVFTNVVDWTYENVSGISDTEDFIVYGDLHDSILGTIVVLHLRVVNEHNTNHIEKEFEKTYFI